MAVALFVPVNEEEDEALPVVVPVPVVVGLPVGEGGIVMVAEALTVAVLEAL